MKTLNDLYLTRILLISQWPIHIHADDDIIYFNPKFVTRCDIL